MPIYEFKCSWCDWTQESIESINCRAIIDECPVCGQLTMQHRVMSVPAKPIINGYNEANGYSRKEADA